MLNNESEEQREQPRIMVLAASVLQSPVIAVPVYIFSIIAITFAISESGLFQYLHRLAVPDDFLLLLIEIGTLIAGLVPLLIIARFKNLKLADYGLTWKGMVPETLLGFLLGILLVCIMVGELICLGSYQWLGFNSEAQMLLPLFVCMVVGLTEEIIFRGFIFNTIERSWGTASALVITCVLFGCAHLINPIPYPQKIFGCLALIFEAGLVLNAAYLLNRRLWLPIGLHWAWDFFEGPVFGMVVSGTNIGLPLIKSSLVGNWWQTGGEFGPESSLAGIFTGTIFGVILLCLALKRKQWMARKIE